MAAAICCSAAANGVNGQMRAWLVLRGEIAVRDVVICRTTARRDSTKPR